MDRAVLCFCPYPEEQGDSHALLRRAAARYAGCTQAALGPLEAGPWGKPGFARRPELQFSLSHSGDWWLCGFAPRPLGVDLQVHRSRTAPAALSRRFFHPDEDAYLAAGGYQRFYDLWCAKESWVKYTGRGFAGDLSDFSVVSPAGGFPSRPGAWLRVLPFAPGYSLCLCAAAPLAVEFAALL